MRLYRQAPATPILIQQHHEAVKNHTTIALLICAAIFLAAAWQNRVPPSPDETYRLSPHGDSLILEVADDRGEEGGEAVDAQLTPFLFMKIPVNGAEPPLLESIPGIGPSLSARIVAYREEEGAIESGADLLKIHGIGPAKLKMLENHISYERP